MFKSEISIVIGCFCHSPFSKKYNLIAFHIVCVLLGYLFYQLYINSADGSKYLGKSLPVILKNYNEHTLIHLVLYGGKYFCCMSMIEFFEFRDSCSAEVKKYLLEIFKEKKAAKHITLATLGYLK